MLIREDSFSIMILTFILRRCLREKRKQKSNLENDAENNTFYSYRVQCGSCYLNKLLFPDGKVPGEETCV